MKIKDILEATGGTFNNAIGLDTEIKDIKIDSRKISNGDVFVAIAGSNFDGHDFADEAINNGALMIISSRDIIQNIPYIKTDDTIKALGDIASYLINKYKPKVIGITGSTGKTTTRNLIYHLLREKYNCLTNEKNYNNNVGVPLTIFNLKKNTDFLILELGMNHPLEISYLSKMIKPDVSIITNIGSSHIGFLKGRENILKAKLEILDGMDEKILFINGDDPLLKNINGVKKISSGITCDNDLIIYNVKSDLYTSSFNLKYNNLEYFIEVKLPYHLISDVLLAINVALYYKIDMDIIAKSLKSYKSIDKRMDILKDKNNNTIINDCYNSSFESLTGVLNLLQRETQKKLLILGDIKELGSYSKKIHASIKPYLDKIDNKNVFLVGEEMKFLKTNAKYFNNYSEVISYLKTKNIKDTLILIKGSRSLRLENICDYFIKSS